MNRFNRTYENHFNTINIVNKRYGKLLVISRSEIRLKETHAYWLCRCDCGKEIHVNSASLRHRGQLSCGCAKFVDITGQKFNRFTAIRPTKPTSNIWECVCDCGNIRFLALSQLRNNKTKSCGCYAREAAAERIRQRNTTHGLSQTKEYRFAFNSQRKRLIAQTDDSTITTNSLLIRASEFDNKCVYCHTGNNENYDHIIPLSRGGKHTILNIVPSCQKCNYSKKAKILFVEWLPPANRYGLKS